MSESNHGPGVRVPPPFIYMGGFLVGWLIERVWPLASFEAPTNVIVGIVLVALGLVLVAPSAALFQRAGTNLAPHRPTTSLVFTGPYRFTRNPIYLGFALIYAGAAVWSHTTWSLVALPLVLLVINQAVIAREERYLEATYGREYLDYKERTRRWL